MDCNKYSGHSYYAMGAVHFIKDNLSLVGDKICRFWSEENKVYYDFDIPEGWEIVHSGEVQEGDRYVIPSQNIWFSIPDKEHDPDNKYFKVGDRVSKYVCVTRKTISTNAVNQTKLEDITNASNGSRTYCFVQDDKINGNCYSKNFEITVPFNYYRVKYGYIKNNDKKFILNSAHIPIFIKVKNSVGSKIDKNLFVMRPYSKESKHYKKYITMNPSEIKAQSKDVFFEKYIKTVNNIDNKIETDVPLGSSSTIPLICGEPFIEEKVNEVLQKIQVDFENSLDQRFEVVKITKTRFKLSDLYAEEIKCKPDRVYLVEIPKGYYIVREGKYCHNDRIFTEDNKTLAPVWRLYGEQQCYNYIFDKRLIIRPITKENYVLSTNFTAKAIVMDCDSFQQGEKL